MTVGDAVSPWRPQFFRADGVRHRGLLVSEHSRPSMATSGHLFEDMTATYHPPGTLEEFNGKSSHISSGRNSVELHQQCAHDYRRC